MGGELTKFARVGDTVECDVRHPYPSTIRMVLETPAAVAHANSPLMDEKSGWRLAAADGVTGRLTEAEIHAHTWWCPHCKVNVPPEMVTKDGEHYLESGGCGRPVRADDDGVMAVRAAEVRVTDAGWAQLWVHGVHIQSGYGQAAKEHCDKLAAQINAATAGPALGEGGNDGVEGKAK
jgi:hypothetical protein